MRFSLAVVAALASSAMSAPLLNPNLDLGSLLGGATGTVNNVLSNLGALDPTELESTLTGMLGGAVAKVEEVMDVTLAHKLLGLVEDGVPQTVVGTVAHALAMVQSGAPLAAADQYIKAATGGVITSLEETLGVSNLAGLLTM